MGELRFGELEQSTPVQRTRERVGGGELTQLRLATAGPAGKLGAVAPNWFVALPVACALDLAPFAPPPCVRLFAASDLHITVAFLGPVSAEQAHAAFEAACAFSLRPLQISFGAIKALGPAHRPSAFSALLEQGRAEVEQSIGQIRNQICDAAGAARDLRPPLAHLTLARPRRSARPAERAQAMRWAESLVLPPVTAQLTQIALYTWNADRSQTLFHVERARTLTGEDNEL